MQPQNFTASGLTSSRNGLPVQWSLTLLTPIEKDYYRVRLRVILPTDVSGIDLHPDFRTPLNFLGSPLTLWWGSLDPINHTRFLELDFAGITFFEVLAQAQSKAQKLIDDLISHINGREGDQRWFNCLIEYEGENYNLIIAAYSAKGAEREARRAFDHAIQPTTPYTVNCDYLESGTFIRGGLFYNWQVNKE